MQHTKMTQWMLCGVFAALTGILSQIAISFGPVPFNLATFGVFLTGGMLGASYGALSMLIYVLLGAMGAPVFALMTSGIGILVSYTGGYIVGYIVAAWIIGWTADRFGRTMRVLIPAMAAGMLACYILGTAWFMFVTGSSLAQAVMQCIVPFLPVDAAKIALASVLVVRVNSALAASRQAV